MHIILLILKIIGIVLLVLLGVLLAFILLGMFVPVRYRMKGEKKNAQSLEADVRLTWLLHMVSFRLKYKEKVSYRLRILGITVLKGEEDLSSEKDSASKEEEQQRQSRKETKKNSKQQATNYRKKELAKSKDLKKTDSEKKIQSKPKVDSVSEHAKENSLQVTEQHSLTEREQSKTDFQNENCESAFKENDAQILSFKETKTDEQADTESKIQENRLKQQINKAKIGKTKTEKGWERICQFLVDGWNKIKKLFKKAKQFCADLCKKKEQAVKVFGMIKDFFYAQENKAGIRVLWEGIKKLGKHCKPKKWDYKVRFGTGNPAQMGQLLGVISGVGGMIGIMPNIIPEFQEEVLEGDFFGKGRIQIFYLLWLFIGIWKNEDFHNLKHNFEKVRRNL